MCKAQDKLVIFSYILGELIKLQKDMIPEDSTKTNGEILKTFSNTRIMKLLYCVCLESLYTSDNDVANENIDPNNLFEELGAFTAFPNGPVLLDIYKALDIIPGFAYVDGQFVDLVEERYQVVIERLERMGNHIIDRINLAVRRLGEHMNSELFQDREDLVDLTHNLPNWKQAFIYNSHKEMTTELPLLRVEYATYTNIVRNYN